MVILTFVGATILFTGCASSEKYYSSKSKKYKKLKRRYEKYDCGCDAFPGTRSNDPVKSCAYPQF